MCNGHGSLASMLFNGGSSQQLVLVLQLVPYLLKAYVSLMSGCIFSSIFIAENLCNILTYPRSINEIQVGILSPPRDPKKRY